MVKRRHKKRTHRVEEHNKEIPESMVLKIGSNDTGKSLAELVRDMRNVMQPHTAVKLRERKANKLKDYLAVTGPLGVSHLLLFSRSASGNVSLRVAKTPRGPTVQFHVESYSLAKDIQASQKIPHILSKGDMKNPPLVVLNNFASGDNVPAHQALVTSMFQNMFPAISANTASLSKIRRVFMLNRVDGDVYDFRHYVITTKPVGVSKPLQKLYKARDHLGRKLPNLAGATDVADYVLQDYTDPGAYTSESEVDEDDASTVKVLQSNDNNKDKTKPEPDSQIQRRSIRLAEVGPRMRLRLVKIEQDVCGGKVLYHSYVEKTQAQEKQLERRHEQRNQQREKRRLEQAERVKVKRAKLSRTKRGKLKARAAAATDSDNDENDENQDQSQNVEDLDDYDLALADAEQPSDSDDEQE